MQHVFGNKPLHVQFVQFIIWTYGLGAAIWEYYGIFRGGLAIMQFCFLYLILQTNLVEFF